jgi:hypothetical protein
MAAAISRMQADLDKPDTLMVADMLAHAPLRALSCSGRIALTREHDIKVLNVARELGKSGQLP